MRLSYSTITHLLFRSTAPSDSKPNIFQTHDFRRGRSFRSALAADRIGPAWLIYLVATIPIVHPGSLS